jgi:hypothetical protein
VRPYPIRLGPKKRRAVDRARRKLNALMSRNARPRRVVRAQDRLKRRIEVEARRKRV